MAGAFGLDNLPYGSIRRAPSAPPRLCVALGENAVEVAPLAERLPDIPRELIDAPNLDPLLRSDPQTWSVLREGLREALGDGPPPRA